jgi:hypothetical protein
LKFWVLPFRFLFWAFVCVLCLYFWKRKSKVYFIQYIFRFSLLAGCCCCPFGEYG